MPQTAAARADAEIQQDVMRELKWDTRVAETEVGVEVNDGVVTLTGTVGSWARRVAAEEAAHRVRSVLDVANDLVVRIPGTGTPTDAQVAQAVRHALQWDVLVPDTRIRSTVVDGAVTLAGAVDTCAQSDDAARAVRNLAGVRTVVNLIEVEAPRVDAGQLRKAIETALARQAEREARGVWFEIEDGAVKVRGRVHSWAERETVIGAARGTPGVRAVEDHLEIEPL